MTLLDKDNTHKSNNQGKPKTYVINDSGLWFNLHRIPGSHKHSRLQILILLDLPRLAVVVLLCPRCTCMVVDNGSVLDHGCGLC